MISCTLILTFIAVGVTCVAGNDCNVTHVSPCYNTLVHYEGLGFPYYGEDDVELDETCKMINDSFECVNSYVGACHNQPECDEGCSEMITDIGLFSLKSGLQDLQLELCNPLSVLRETYLENYVCLEDNAAKYAVCHNDSQRSQEYLDSIKDAEEHKHARCCFYSWYQDCFTNITRDTCNVNATVFVSLTLHKLIGHIARYQCLETPVICERPPLPPEQLDRDKDDQIGNDIDNSINDSSNATHVLVSMSHIVTLLLCAIVLKPQFSIK